MTQALLYLSFKSAENLVRSRLGRLREPRYLIGAVFGVAYFYFFFIRQRGLVPGTRPVPGSPWSPAWGPEVIASLGAVILLARAAFAWAAPDARPGVGFTEPEIAFLFPAPCTRRQLIAFKLASSQGRILLSSLILMAVSNRWRFLGGSLLTHAVGWWLILSTLSLHVMGASLTVTRLIDRGVSAARRRSAVLAVVAGAVVATLASAYRGSGGLSSLGDASDPLQWLERFADSGALHWLLLPFKAVIEPFAARDTRAFLLSLPLAAAVVAAHALWVLTSNASFEEAAIGAAEKRAARIAALRSGTFRLGHGKPKARRGPFALRETGRPEIAFLWKNLLSTRPYFTPRAFAVCSVLIVGTVSWISHRPDFARVFLPLIFGFSCAIGGYIFLVGPQVARQDLRSDLSQADILKAYPLRGWQIVLGEILTPVAILTGLIWLTLLAAFCAAFYGRTLSGFLTPGALVAVAAGVAAVVPVLCALQLLTSNAVAVLFPSWQPIAQPRAGGAGIEVFGQRMLLSLGRLLILAVALVPPTVVGVVLTFTAWLLGAPLAALLTAGSAVVILGSEVALALFLVGRRFEKLDLSQELRA